MSWSPMSPPFSLASAFLQRSALVHRGRGDHAALVRNRLHAGELACCDFHNCLLEPAAFYYREHRTAPTTAAAVAPARRSRRSAAAASARATSVSRAFVAGCRGVNSVQQSWSGMIEIGYVPSRCASAVISSLSIPTSGRSTGIATTSLIAVMFSSVCDATWPTTSPVTSARRPVLARDRFGDAHHQPAVDHDAQRRGDGEHDALLDLAERDQEEPRVDTGTASAARASSRAFSCDARDRIG